MKCRFSAKSYVFLQASQRFFEIAVNLGKRYFCKHGRMGFTFSFVPRTVLNKLITATRFPFFQSDDFRLMKKISFFRTVNDITPP